MDRKVDRTVPPLARTPTLLMLLAFAAASSLHLGRVQFWYFGIVAASLLWHWLHYAGRSRLPLPNRWVRYLLTAILVAVVLLSFGTLNGLRAGTGLLLVMGAMKLQETRTSRDAVVVATVALILVLAAALDRQNLLRVPLYFTAAWLALASIAALGGFRAQQSVWLAMRRAATAMLLAIPFAVLAFVLVPRLPGALWSMSTGEQAQTGLSDEMSPGGISDLAVSDAIAFRVRFDGAAPAPSVRYWRGPVLHDFDGNTWRNQRGLSLPPRQAMEYLADQVRYQITLEPHGRTWLFALETGETLRGRRNLPMPDGQFLAHQPVTSTIVYRGVSWLRVRQTGELSNTARRRDTRLPQGRNPRTLELARSLRDQAASDSDYAALVMRYFADNGFEYTLTPPQLDYNSIDDLLFNTRLGFCGHFASAYVTLMRAAGVPARVVTGYLGGTWNPVGDYYLVRQSDAHAWAEVWLDGQGWVRFDPTGMVAPGRLERGLGELLPATRSAATNFVQQSSWLRRLRDSWDAAGTWWREQVVNFNDARQRDLLEKLGLGNLDFRGMGALLLGGATAWGLVLLLVLRIKGRDHGDALGRLWNRYLTLLVRRGLPIAAHEGPERIRRRAQRQWPEAATVIERFTRDYADLRFGAREPSAVAGAMPGLRTLLRSIARATAARRPPRTAAAAPG